MMQTLAGIYVVGGAIVCAFLGLMFGPLWFFASFAVLGVGAALIPTLYEGCHPDDFIGVGQWQIELARFCGFRK